MPRLDAERIALWRDLCTMSARLQRAVDRTLTDVHDLPLAWFDVLTEIRNGGGSIRASSGFAVQSEIAAGVSGGGKIDLRAIEAGSVAAGVNGGGLILVRPRSTLAAGISGGGEVRYWGNPQVTSAINGGGSVRPGT